MAECSLGQRSQPFGGYHNAFDQNKQLQTPLLLRRSAPGLHDPQSWHLEHSAHYVVGKNANECSPDNKTIRQTHHKELKNAAMTFPSEIVHTILVLAMYGFLDSCLPPTDQPRRAPRSQSRAVLRSTLTVIPVLWKYPRYFQI